MRVILVRSVGGVNEEANAEKTVFGSGGGGAKEEEAKAVFEVKLESFEASMKIKTIREIKSLTGCGLKEAKALLEKAPSVLKTGVSREEGEKMVETLKALVQKLFWNDQFPSLCMFLGPWYLLFHMWTDDTVNKSLLT